MHPMGRQSAYPSRAPSAGPPPTDYPPGYQPPADGRGEYPNYQHPPGSQFHSQRNLNQPRRSGSFHAGIAHGPPGQPGQYDPYHHPGGPPSTGSHSRRHTPPMWGANNVPSQGIFFIPIEMAPGFIHTMFPPQPVPVIGGRGDEKKKKKKKKKKREQATEEKKEVEEPKKGTRPGAKPQPPQKETPAQRAMRMAKENAQKKKQPQPQNRGRPATKQPVPASKAVATAKGKTNATTEKKEAGSSPDGDGKEEEKETKSEEKIVRLQRHRFVMPDGRSIVYECPPEPRLPPTAEEMTEEDLDKTEDAFRMWQQKEDRFMDNLYRVLAQKLDDEEATRPARERDFMMAQQRHYYEYCQSLQSAQEKGGVAGPYIPLPPPPIEDIFIAWDEIKVEE